MRFTDEGIVLGAKRLGEKEFVVKIFTKEHGLFSGMLGGVKSGGLQAALCAGSVVMVSWQARLEEHLGRWKIEELVNVPNLSPQLGMRCTLMGGLLMKSLAHGDSHADFYQKTKTLLLQNNDLNKQSFLGLYGLWEKELLAVSGFGLDIRTCVVTGGNDNLCYISPRSGRAVSEEGAGEYKPRLLKLPSFWHQVEKLGINGEKHAENWKVNEIVDSLHTTGHFLMRQGFLDKVLFSLRGTMVEELEELMVHGRSSLKVWIN